MPEEGSRGSNYPRRSLASFDGSGKYSKYLESFSLITARASIFQTFYQQKQLVEVGIQDKPS